MKNFSERHLIERIEKGYQTLSGECLPGPDALNDRAWWLHHEAPYGLLAHGTGSDPLFIYANHSALQAFDYSPEQLLQLPSRLSADTPDQKERQQMLESLASNGIVYGYSGVRITRQGVRFRVYNGVIWSLRNAEGSPWGQAALIWLSEDVQRFDVSHS